MNATFVLFGPDIVITLISCLDETRLGVVTWALGYPAKAMTDGKEVLVMLDGRTVPHRVQRGRFHVRRRTGVARPVPECGRKRLCQALG